MSKVSAVDVTSPPMTTVASGRCTSAPADVTNAIGMKAETGNERGHQHGSQSRLRALEYRLVSARPCWRSSLM